MEKSQETGEIHIQFLHTQGPAASFTYPVQLDELTLPMNHILSLHTPTSSTGRTYILTLVESKNTSQLLKQFQENVHEM
jgi:hypothetical protein